MAHQVTLIDDHTGYCYLRRNVIDEPGKLFTELLEDANWENERVKIRGNWVTLSRKTAAYTDNVDTSFLYSGLNKRGEIWSEPMLKLKEQVENITGKTFNFALLNLYASGNDIIGWHSDDVRKHAEGSVIASVSLGATRDFVIAPTVNNPMLSKDFRMKKALNSGDLLVMDCNMQKYYKHTVPKRTNNLPCLLPDGESTIKRINVTFRQME